LGEVSALLRGEKQLPAATPVPSTVRSEPDVRDVRGQLQARRALVIAAAGEHHLLLCGPPGCGKTLLASRLPGLLPPMTETQALEARSEERRIGQEGRR